MILGKQRTSAMLFVVAAVIVICLALTYVWATHHKAVLPATAPLHDRR